jgi:PTS system cellobiose-specific IIA component
MELIVSAGSARSFAMDAIRLAKEGDMAAAREALEASEGETRKVHETQTGLIQAEARGERTEINLFMVHAQDHIMTAMLAKELAREFVDLYGRMAGEKS